MCRVRQSRTAECPAATRPTPSGGGERDTMVLFSRVNFSSFQEESYFPRTSLHGESQSSYKFRALKGHASLVYHWFWIATIGVFSLGHIQSDYCDHSFMDDIYSKVEVYPDHFQESKGSDDIPQSSKRNDYSLSQSWAVRRLMDSTSILNLFRLPSLPWASKSNDNDKVELSVAEVASLRTEIVDAEEREAHLKAQLEHIDELLKVARLSGYLYIRTRWSELPEEPPILDDEDVDDWLPRFVVLNGQCIFYYLKSTDLSPQDTTMLVDIVEAAPLPSFLQGGQRRYAFYILTCHGLRFECCSVSKVQADSWLATLHSDCKLETLKRQLDL